MVLATSTSADTQTPIVHLHNVSKRFSNGTLALEKLSLDVAEGSFVSLLGASGCGKSTALRIIAGLSEKTSGTISHGMPQSLDDDALGNVGFVFQEPTLMPWANVFQNVYLPFKLQYRGRKNARERVWEALETVGLKDVAGNYPRSLSGGMKMRVSIARALVTRPRLLLMDEPFAALDEITRFKLSSDLLNLWKKLNFTVIFVTHSVFESVYLSERIVVMAGPPGRVAADLAINEPYPRDESFRSSPAYAGHVREAQLALKEAMTMNGGGNAS